MTAGRHRDREREIEINRDIEREPQGETEIRVLGDSRRVPSGFVIHSGRNTGKLGLTIQLFLIKSY